MSSFEAVLLLLTRKTHSRRVQSRATLCGGASVLYQNNIPPVDFIPAGKVLFLRIMDARGLCFMLCVLLLAHTTSQQSSPKKRGGKKDAANNAAIDELKKQIKDIVQELNLLKEQQALQTVCLRGTKIVGKCFLADPVKKTYHVANDDCIAKGGTLSTPLTGTENDQLHAYVGQSIGPEEHIWLGINDMVTDGLWVDQSGLAVRFKNWETDITLQPDGGRGQNCAVMSSTANGKWFDESCRAEKASVCEFNIV